jgi:hypothetical protein
VSCSKRTVVADTPLAEGCVLNTTELPADTIARMQVYTAAKSGVECVLRLDGSLHILPTVFHDLAVPGGTKITEAPAEAPPAA